MPAPVPAAAGPSPAARARSPGAPARPTAYAPVPLGAPRPVIDSLFGDLWPERGLVPQVRLLLACLGVGVLSAVVLPYRAFGVALFGVLVARRCRPLAHHEPPGAGGRSSAASCASRSPHSRVLRAAEWLTVIAVMLGVVVLTTALTDAKGLPAAPGRTRVLAPRGRARAAPARAAPSPSRAGSASLWPVVRTAAISLVALVVFGGLFASGDAIFGSWAQALRAPTSRGTA